MYKEDACIRNMLSDLPTELWEDFRRVWRENLDEKKYVLGHKYSLGVLAAKAYKLENSSLEHKGLQEKIIKRLNISSKRVLDRTRRFVEFFSKKEIDKLTKVTDSGFCICWSHFEFTMMNYLSKPQMIEYLEFAREYSIPPLELYKKIQRDNDRVSTSNRAKKILSAKEFVKTARDYLDSCATKDAWLSRVPDDVLQSWKTEMSLEDLEGIIKQLENHVTKCYLLKERLCR